MTDALSIANLSHRFGDRLALDGVSFDIRRGAIFALLGPNASGKTTLFRIISTLLRADEGDVRVDGHLIRHEPSAVRRALGVVFQSPALDPRLTVAENLTHHGHLHQLSGRELRARIDHALDQLRLTERRHDRVDTLSGGLQRRAEIAKSLLSRPAVLLLDEPSTGLDPSARRDLAQTLVTVRDTWQTTVVFTTHLMDEAARADHVAILHHGRLVALDSPQALVASVGADVLWISTSTPESLLDRLEQRFQLPGRVVDGRIRIERADASPFIPQLVEAFPGEIDAITYARPTLDDVFVHHTGERM